MSFPWAKWEALAREIEAEGISASAIADELSAAARHPLSRNAVIGWLHRKGIWGGGKGPKCKPEPAPKAKPLKGPDHQHRGMVTAIKIKAKRLRKAAAAVQVEEAKHLKAAEPEGVPQLPAGIVNAEDLRIPMAQRLSLIELKDWTCKWPVGDPGQPGFFFCGAKTVDGEVYCRRHLARSWQEPAPPRGKRFAKLSVLTGGKAA
jgi:GcrA cell cycle regulator